MAIRAMVDNVTERLLGQKPSTEVGEIYASQPEQQVDPRQAQYEAFAHDLEQRFTTGVDTRQLGEDYDLRVKERRLLGGDPVAWSDFVEKTVYQCLADNNSPIPRGPDQQREMFLAAAGVYETVRASVLVDVSIDKVQSTGQLPSTYVSALSKVADFMHSSDETVTYNIQKHTALLALVDAVGHGAEPEVVTGLKTVYQKIVKGTSDHRVDDSPSRNAVMATLDALDNIRARQTISADFARTIAAATEQSSDWRSTLPSRDESKLREKLLDIIGIRYDQVHAKLLNADPSEIASLTYQGREITRLCQASGVSLVVTEQDEENKLVDKLVTPVTPVSDTSPGWLEGTQVIIDTSQTEPDRRIRVISNAVVTFIALGGLAAVGSGQEASAAPAAVPEPFTPVKLDIPSHNSRIADAPFSTAGMEGTMIVTITPPQSPEVNKQPEETQPVSVEEPVIVPLLLDIPTEVDQDPKDQPPINNTETPVDTTIPADEIKVQAESPSAVLSDSGYATVERAFLSKYPEMAGQKRVNTTVQQSLDSIVAEMGDLGLVDPAEAPKFRERLIYLKLLADYPDLLTVDPNVASPVNELILKGDEVNEPFRTAVMSYLEQNHPELFSEYQTYTDEQLDVLRELVAATASFAGTDETRQLLINRMNKTNEGPAQPQEPIAPEQDNKNKDDKSNEESANGNNGNSPNNNSNNSPSNYEISDAQIRSEVSQIVNKLDGLDNSKKRFVSDVAAGALRAERDGAQINVEVTIAQAILESGWGGSGLAKEHNNLFGMKAGSDWRGDTVVITTTEYDDEKGKYYKTDATWRVYPSIEASIKDYAHDFIGAKPWYSDAQQFAGDPDKYIDGLLAKIDRNGNIIIAQGRPGAMSYATDPEYKSKLLSMIRSNNLGKIADLNGRPEQKLKNKIEKHKNTQNVIDPDSSLREQILNYPGVSSIVSETNTGSPLPDKLGEVVYFSQWDRKWYDKEYNWPGGSGKTIASSGCGPATQAMIISTLSNKRVTPEDMAKWNQKHGYRANGGTSHAAFTESARAYGLNAAFIDDGVEGIRNAVRSGKLVIVNGTDSDLNTPATDAGHIYIVRDLTPSGQFIVNDANSISKSLKIYDPATIANVATVAVAVWE